MLPLHPRLATLALVLAMVHWLIDRNWKLRWTYSSGWQRFLLPAFYGLYLLSFFYTDNTLPGLASLETKLPFVVCPLLLFFSPPLSRLEIRRLLYWFVLGSLLASLICLGGATYWWFSAGENYFSYKLLSSFLEAHPTYQSMYTGFALFVVVERLWREFRVLQRLEWWGLLVLALYLFAFILLLAARMELLAVVFLLGLSLLIAMHQKGQLWKGLMLAGVGLLLLASVIWTVPTTKARLSRMLGAESTAQSSSEGNVRWKIWDAALGQVKDAWLFGYGAGDVQAVLEEAYREKNYESALKSHLNAHNQYFQILLSIGLLGLLLWVGLLLYPLAITRLAQQPFLWWFLALFALSCLTESMLESQRGTLFFCFFYCLLFPFFAVPKQKEANIS